MAVRLQPFLQQPFEWQSREDWHGVVTGNFWQRVARCAQSPLSTTPAGGYFLVDWLVLACQPPVAKFVDKSRIRCKAANA
jgi:hypothetical protein